MEYRKLGKTGIDVPAVSYGGIVSTKDGQAASDRYVRWAIEKGVTYFDVAPSYGDAQEKLGNSLAPYRGKVCLACKTQKRTRAEAEIELNESMRLLHTDHFDVYQLHQVSSLEEVERIFAPGGVMEMMRRLKDDGVAAHLGITAHNEDAALKAIELFDFDTVMFPFNWLTHMSRGLGTRLLAAAKERGMGVLCIKSFIERKWIDENERHMSRYPKSWCKPIDIEDEAFGLAAMKYTLSLGVDTLIPPGNIESFTFMAEHIDECLKNPMNGDDMELLERRLGQLRGMEFI